MSDLLKDDKIYLAKVADGKDIFLHPEMANRHGLIAGASGTGKTVTLKVMAESFSELGVPVFLADIKGDIGGMCLPGNQEKMGKRAKEKFGINNFTTEGFPCAFWDIYGEHGNPVRTTVEGMGPALIGRLLDLSDVQTDVLNIIFRVVKENRKKFGEIATIEDLRAVTKYISDNKDDFTGKYGTMSTQSLGAVQRALLVLEDMGGDIFFGKPELDIMDWMTTDEETGYGMVNILNSVKLAHNPTLYATFMIWLMSTLFEILPEEGDLSAPKLVFFFDEAHMLFSDAPKMLVQKVEQMVKLIRSKGVGVYFISQSPSDIPDSVLSQLSNRVQHALRAYTPAEQKAVKAAAAAFRKNKDFNTEEVIMDLGVGEVLISCLDEDGRPSVVERAFITPPKSFLGAISDEEYENQINNRPELKEKYKAIVDEKTASFKIDKIYDTEKADKEAADNLKNKKAEMEKERKEAEKKEAEKKKSSSSSKKSGSTAKNTTNTAIAKATSSAATAVGRELGKALVKGLFGKKK